MNCKIGKTYSGKTLTAFQRFKQNWLWYGATLYEPKKKPFYIIPEYDLS